MESATSQELMSRQLVRIAAELRDLGLFANASAIDPEILADFRSAVDHARSTAWAVQHCLQAHDENAQVYPILVRERIRRVVELCDALMKDIQFPQTKASAADRELLHKALKRLCNHLQFGLR
jgi:hypothetical protein